MDTFELINGNRIEHGYVHKNLQMYKRFCNRRYTELKKSRDALAVAYKAEANLAKFLLFNSLRYLRKNMKLLGKASSDFSRAYARYTMCFIENHRNALSVDALVGLRHELADYYSFLDDIYALNNNRHDFDQYKIVYQWHDITLLFETQKLLDSFLGGTLVLEDHRFNTQLALKISALERDRREFVALVQDPKSEILPIFERSKRLFDDVRELKQFLDDNFLASSFVADRCGDISAVHTFIANLLEFKNGNLHAAIDGFSVPVYFADCTEALESLRGRRMVDPRRLRTILINLLEERLGTDVAPRKMPYLPVFYDLAYDFINYPSAEEGIVGTLKDLDFLNKK